MNEKNILIISLSMMIFFYIIAVYLAVPTFKADTTLLSAILVMAGFTFPTLYKILSDERKEPGESFAVFTAFMIGLSLILAILPLVFGIDTFLASLSTIAFVALGIIFIAMAFQSLRRW